MELVALLTMVIIIVQIPVTLQRRQMGAGFPGVQLRLTDH
jgi:hypothetical protein